MVPKTAISADSRKKNLEYDQFTICRGVVEPWCWDMVIFGCVVQVIVITRQLFGTGARMSSRASKAFVIPPDG